MGALARVSDPWTARQCRRLAYVAEFTSDIRHVAGQDNVAADALSRPPISTITAPSQPTGVVADLQGIAARQLSCQSTLQASKSPSLQVKACEVEGVSLLCDESTGRLRPLVPETDRPLVFEAIHGVAHPGIRATRRLIAARFLWPGMRSDIASWCRSCVACQRAKVTRQPRAPVQPIPIPKRRFSHMHEDLVGQLPVSAEGYVYLLTMIDRTTRWLEAIPLRETSAASCVEAFFFHWVARFGVSETLTSDRGAQFSSSTWAAFCSRLGIKHVMTTAYHPQANGLVERAHRQLKDGLRARQAGVDWPAHLPWVLLGLHAVPKEISGVSSAEAVFGQPLVRPGELASPLETLPMDFLNELSSSTPPATCQPRTYAEVAAQPSNWRLQSADMVYVRKGGCSPPLAPAYVGPYKVVLPGPKAFVLEVEGRRETVSVDRLKPHLGSALPAPAAPPRRGRPPGGDRNLQPHRSLGWGGGGHVEAANRLRALGKSPNVNSRKCANCVIEI